MTKYTVTGGNPLKGQVELHGAKNAGFKAMIAALLANSPSTLTNLGLISEIDFAKQVITSLGGKIEETGDPHNLKIDPTNLTKFEIPQETSSRSRFSMMYAGPLLAKFGRVVFPLPGGDQIGKRPIDRSMMGLEALGVEINFDNGIFSAVAKNGLVGNTIHFAKNSHTGTEMLLTAAVLAKGTTILENAAQEPEVDNLIDFLNAMGAQIERTSPRTIKIIGVKDLHGATHEIMSDRNEAVTYGCMALATKGDIEIKKADPNFLTEFLDEVQKIGGGVELQKDSVRIFWKNNLNKSDVLVTPYPGFMSDWQPLWATLMTQSVGMSTLHEAVYESRFDYVPALLKMGAKIEPFQPDVADPQNFYNFNLEDDNPQNKHAIKIYGPTPLHGQELEVNDIRSGATALLAGMIADGKTVIFDLKDQIKRGYEDLPQNLQKLSAQVEVLQ